MPVLALLARACAKRQPVRNNEPVLPEGVIRPRPVTRFRGTVDIGEIAPSNWQAYSNTVPVEPAVLDVHVEMQRRDGDGGLDVPSGSASFETID